MRIARSAKEEERLRILDAKRTFKSASTTTAVPTGLLLRRALSHQQVTPRFNDALRSVGTVWKDGLVGKQDFRRAVVALTPLLGEKLCDQEQCDALFNAVDSSGCGHVEIAALMQQFDQRLGGNRRRSSRLLHSLHDLEASQEVARNLRAETHAKMWGMDREKAIAAVTEIERRDAAEKGGGGVGATGGAEGGGGSAPVVCHSSEAYFTEKLDRAQLHELLRKTNMTRAELFRLFNRCALPPACQYRYLLRHRHLHSPPPHTLLQSRRSAKFRARRARSTRKPSRRASRRSPSRTTSSSTASSRSSTRTARAPSSGKNL